MIDYRERAQGVRDQECNIGWLCGMFEPERDAESADQRRTRSPVKPLPALYPSHFGKYRIGVHRHRAVHPAK